MSTDQNQPQQGELRDSPDQTTEEARDAILEEQGTTLADINKPKAQPPGYQVRQPVVPETGVLVRLEIDHYLWGRYFEAGSVVRWDEKRDGKMSAHMKPVRNQSGQTVVVDSTKAPPRSAKRTASTQVL